MKDKQISHSYAFGWLNSGVRDFRGHFEVMARCEGLDPATEVLELMEKMLLELSDESSTRAIEYQESITNLL